MNFSLILEIFNTKIKFTINFLELNTDKFGINNL